MIAFGFAVAGRQFICILYGEDFLSAWTYATIIIFPMFFNSFNDVILNVLDVLNKRHVRSMILMTTTALNFILTVLGIKYMGMLGAALATGVATILQVIILNIYYHKYIGINTLYLFKHGLKGLFPALIFSAICALPINLITDNKYISFFACGAVFLILFFVIYYFWGSNSCEKEYLKKLFPWKRKIQRGENK